MDLSILNDFIAPLILVAGLVVGYVIKHAIPNDTINRYIPLILAVVGIALNCWANMGISPEIVVIGAVSGLASTGIYQLFSQLIEKGFIGDKTQTNTEEVTQ